MFGSDLNVNRVVKIRYFPGFCSELHDHNFYHSVYILSGTGIINISGKEYIVQQDEFFLIPPYTMHQIKTLDNKEYQTIEVKFLLINELFSEKLQILPTRMNMFSFNIRFLLNDIMCEAKNQDVYYSEIINTNFADVLFLLLRDHLHNESKNKQEEQHPDNNFCDPFKNIEKSNTLYPAISYIEKNLYDELNLGLLAKICNYSEAYFCTLFKQEFNITPIQYINNLKLIKAKDLLLHSDMNISQVAYSLGFGSLHYFSKVFKKYEKISPQEYIHKNKNDLRVDIILM